MSRPRGTSRALVTGAGGFVGRHLGQALADQGFEIHGLGLTSSSRPPEWPGSWITGDLTVAEDALRVIREVGPDSVFHLAALTKGDSLAEFLRVNAVGTDNLLSAVVSSELEARVLVAGSSAEYGLVRPEELPLGENQALRPLSPYGVSKAAQSLIAAQYAPRHGLAVVRTRTFNLTGPGEPDTLVCSAFARQVAEIETGLRPPVLRVGSLVSARDFLDVRDAVLAYVELAERGIPGEVYNVASSEAVSVAEILAMLLDECAVNVTVEDEPARHVAWDVPVQRGDTAKLRGLIGWSRQIDLRRSMRDLLDDWRRRLAENA